MVNKSNGSKKLLIGATNTPVSLGSAFTPAGSFPVNRVDIQAITTNAAKIYIGDNGVQNGPDGGGIFLAPGDVYNIEIITDLIGIFANGQIGDGITFNWWIGDRV